MSWPPSLYGEFVKLREINPEIDCHRFYEIMLEPDMHNWTGNNIPSKIEESKDQLEQYASLKDLLSWAVVRIDNNELLGTYWIAMPSIVEGKRIITAEAQRIDKKYWRKGYTKEARKLIYDFAFNKLNVNEIHAQAWSNNVNSCESMKRSGFRLLKTENRIFKKYNKIFTENHYCLSRNSWVENHSKKQK